MTRAIWPLPGIPPAAKHMEGGTPSLARRCLAWYKSL
jgi:hypothetical protein